MIVWLRHHCSNIRFPFNVQYVLCGPYTHKSSYMVCTGSHVSALNATIETTFIHLLRSKSSVDLMPYLSVFYSPVFVTRCVCCVLFFLLYVMLVRIQSDRKISFEAHTTKIFCRKKKNFVFCIEHVEQAFNVPIRFFFFVSKNAIHALHIRIESDTIRGIQAHKTKYRLHLLCTIHFYKYSTRMNEDHKIFFIVTWAFALSLSLFLFVFLFLSFEYENIARKIHYCSFFFFWTTMSLNGVKF